MSKYYVISRPVRKSEIDFVDLQDTEESWKQKAHELRARRWRRLRESIKTQPSRRHEFHRHQNTF